jgi:hypothetical protein
VRAKPAPPSTTTAGCRTAIPRTGARPTARIVVISRIGPDVRLDAGQGTSKFCRGHGEHDPAEDQLSVAIETSSGLLVAGLHAAGRAVFAINPVAVSPYRDGYRTCGGKSHAFDALVLANAPRTGASTPYRHHQHSTAARLDASTV